MEYVNNIELAGNVHNLTKSEDGIVRFDLHTCHAYKAWNGEAKVATQIHSVETKAQEDITEGDFLHLIGKLIYRGQDAVIVTNKICKVWR